MAKPQLLKIMNQIQVCLCAASHFCKKVHPRGGVEIKQNDWRSLTHSQKQSKRELQCPSAEMGMIYYLNVSSLQPSPQLSSFYSCGIWLADSLRQSVLSCFNIKYIRSLITGDGFSEVELHVSGELNPLMISTTTFSATSMRLKSLECVFSIPKKGLPQFLAL